MELKGKTVQVKPKGLFGFDIRVKNSNATFTSFMGSPELGRAVGEFVSRSIPPLVDTLKFPLFDVFHDTLVTVINEVLKSNGTTLMEDEFVLPELPFDEWDSSEEASSEELDFGETEFEA